MKAVFSAILGSALRNHAHEHTENPASGWVPISSVTLTGPPNASVSCSAILADLVSSHRIARLRGLCALSRVTIPSCCAAIEIASIRSEQPVWESAPAKALHQFSGSVSLAGPERKTSCSTRPLAFIPPLSTSTTITLVD